MATCANLLKSLVSLWTFLRDARVETTNNDAERALRGIVIKRKISGPTRSRRGDEFIVAVQYAPAESVASRWGAVSPFS